MLSACIHTLVCHKKSFFAFSSQSLVGPPVKLSMDDKCTDQIVHTIGIFILAQLSEITATALYFAK